MTENEIAREVVDAAYKIHSTYGPGLLELAIVYTVDESGNTTAAGTKSAQVQTAHYGQRLLYSVESSDAQGTAQQLRL
jgi:hypothetical protein